MHLSDKDLHKVKEYFSKQPILKAYLFGSFARGEATECSDVDILVEIDHTKPIGLGFLSIKFELEDILERKVDLVSSSGLSKYLAPIINREKSLIYAK